MRVTQAGPGVPPVLAMGKLLAVSGSAHFNHHSHLTTDEEWLIRADAKTGTLFFTSFLLRENMV